MKRYKSSGESLVSVSIGESEAVRGVYFLFPAGWFFRRGNLERISASARAVKKSDCAFTLGMASMVVGSPSSASRLAGMNLNGEACFHPVEQTKASVSIDSPEESMILPGAKDFISAT